MTQGNKSLALKAMSLAVPIRNMAMKSMFQINRFFKKEIEEKISRNIENEGIQIKKKADVNKIKSHQRFEKKLLIFFYL